MIYQKEKYVATFFLLKLNVKTPHGIIIANIRLTELSLEYKPSRRKQLQ